MYHILPLTTLPLSVILTLFIYSIKMPPKLTDRSQRTRSAAASRLEIAQGKGHFPKRKQPPETIANTSQAIATAPKHKQPPETIANTSQAIATAPKRKQPPETIANTSQAIATAPKRKQPPETIANTSQAIATAPPPYNSASAAASTKRATRSAVSTSYFPTKVINTEHLYLDSSEEEEESPAEGERTATNSAETQGKDHTQFSDFVNTGCTEGEATATATHSEAATHSTEARGIDPMPSLLALNTTPNVGLFPRSSTGDLKPAALNEETSSDYDDNDEDGDLKTGGDVKRSGDHFEELTATIMTGGDLKTRGNLLEEPTGAKILKKKVPGGAFSPRRESLGILQDFMRKQKQVSPLFARQAEQDASSPTGENNDFLIQ